MIIGTVGWSEEGMLFITYCRNKRPVSTDIYDIIQFLVEFMEWKKKLLKKARMRNEYILIFNKCAYSIDGLEVKRIRNFDAIGAGTDYALTALHLGHTASEAVEAACDLTIYCELPVQEMEIKL